MRPIRSALAAVVALAATAVIVFLGLMPHPDVRPLGLLPDGFARWLDVQYTSRHVAGFFGFHLLLATLGGITGVLASARSRLRLALGLGIFAVGLELAQLALPLRSVNVEDILASWAGVALAFICAEFVFRRLTRSAAHVN